MRLAKGTRVGPYEIVTTLGSGGMGEVYRARDTRLGRTVALKVLAADMSSDAKIRQRFQREAKAIARVTHPHICALYDVGETQDVDNPDTPIQYLVMEYVEGKTLSEKLKRGALPINDVLRFGIEIADALEKAHRQHILHRDLKPSNIMITASGAVLLDFGLAKFFQPSVAQSWEDSEGFREATTATKSLTDEGSVIGTVEYMAPEQVEGKECDARTDIFALGVCLYEMATGHRPFAGTTRAAIAAAILTHEPAPVTQYQPAAPQSLDWLIRTCLAKDPEERIQTARDVMLHLRQMQREPSGVVQAVPASPVPDRKRLIIPTLIAAVVIASAAAIIQLRRPAARAAKAAVRRLVVPLPASAPLAAGTFEKFAVSPDGRRLVYTAETNPTKLYVYSLDTLSVQPLPQTEGGRGPFFSPDGDWIGFYTAGGALKKISLSGGAPVTLSTGRDLRGATWGADDMIIFGEPWAPLSRISASGGEVREITPRDERTNVRWPVLLPGGQWVLYTVCDHSGDYENAKLAVLSLKTRQSKVVVNGGTYGRYVPTGHLAYLHAETIFAVPFDLETMSITGSPVPILPGVDSYFPAGLAEFAIASDGSLFFIPRDPAETEDELVWVDRNGMATPLSTLRRGFDDPRLSADGKKVLVSLGTGAHSDVWSLDIARNTWNRLTDQATNSSAVWSPDGKRIVFSSNRNGKFDLFVMPSDGSAQPTRLASGQGWLFANSWSPDGQHIVAVETNPKTLTDLVEIDLNGGKGPTPIRVTRANENSVAFSPDGRWIAYASDESGRDEVYVQRYPGTGPKWLVSTEGGTLPAWRGNGRELYYRSGNAMLAVDVKAQDEFAGKPRVLFRGDFGGVYDVTPDGQRFVMVRRQQRTPRTQINVVLGGFEPLASGAGTSR